MSNQIIYHVFGGVCIRCDLCDRNDWTMIFSFQKRKKKERKGTTTTSTVNSIVGLYVAMNCDTINGIY